MYSQVISSAGALTSATTSDTLPVPKNADDIVMLIQVASVTSGATMKLQAGHREARYDGSDDTWKESTVWTDMPIPSFTISTNVPKVYHIKQLFGYLPDVVRLNITARTDGTYTAHVISADPTA